MKEKKCHPSFWVRLFVPADAAVCSSRHLLDQWSIGHAMWGAIFKRVLKMNYRESALSHEIFELFENLPGLVDLLNSTGIELPGRYSGDSLKNTIGDLIAFSIGHWYPQYLEVLAFLFLSWMVSTYKGRQERGDLGTFLS
jgi:hypothetical protein